MKQFSLLTIPILCAAISPLSADAAGNKSSKTNGKQSTQDQTNQITPSANPMVTHWCDPYLTAEFIWWRVQEDGLNYVFSGVAPEADLTSASKGHLHQPKFQYEPGFKVGFGLKFKHDGWDLYANYTWIRTSFSDTRNTVRNSSTSNFLNLWGFGNGGPALLAVLNPGRSTAEWSLHFNALDLELGRNFWISQWLTLRPHFGMKFSWIDQEYDLKFDNVGGSIILEGSNYRMYNDQDAFAVGLRGGLDAAWYLWRKWCIFGELAISAMWNDFDIKRKDKALTEDGNYTSLRLSRNSHTVTGVLELALGLRFETTFHNDDYLFRLQAGWEEQIWFDQNQFFAYFDNATKNMTFEGLTLKTGFDF